MSSTICYIADSYVECIYSIKRPDGVTDTVRDLWLCGRQSARTVRTEISRTVQKAGPCVAICSIVKNAAVSRETSAQ